MIKYIIFDYAGVITPTGSHLPFSKQYHTSLNLTVDQLHDVMRLNWDLAKINEISADEYWENISKILGWPSDLLTERVLETFPNNAAVLSSIGQLSEKYKTILMSNQIAGWIEKSLYPRMISDYFSENFSSYRTGLSKPNPEAFLSLIQKVGGSSSEYLLIDDQKKNIEAAKKLGMQTLLFSLDTDLVTELARLAITFNNKVSSLS